MQFLWFIISILNLSLWQVSQIRGEDLGLLGSSSSSLNTHNGGISSMSSSSASSISSSSSHNHNFNANNANNNNNNIISTNHNNNINNNNIINNNNNNKNMNVNSTMLNTIIGSNKGSIGSAVGVSSSMASVMSSGLGLNSLSPSNAGATSLSALGPVGGGSGVGIVGRDMKGVKNGIGGGSLPSHGHALAGLANLGIIVPGVGGLQGTGTRPYNSFSMGSTMDMSYGSGQTSYYEHHISEHTVMAVFTLQGLVDGPCRYMPATRRQKHQCRKEFGLPETIREARRLATSHCEDQFRYDRWNCTIETRGKRNIFKKLYKETAFVHALTAAAMTHSIARACAEGRMTKCSCGPRKQNRVDQDFQWGGCNDNLKHGKRVTRSFLDLHVRDGDEVTEILRHDSEVGIEAVSTLMKDKCKCHGVSGSCSMKTCWKKLSDFNATATLLRQKYNQAIRKAPNLRTIRESPMNRMKRPKQRRKKQQSQYTTLYYLETSPTYCSVTKDRQCLHPDNCANLCCGRGYTTHVFKQVEKCRCRFNNGRCCNLICDYCQRYEDRYFCK